MLTDLPNSNNIAIRFDGPVLYIYCDLEKDFGVSSSGKSIVIASSKGNKSLGSSNVSIGLNLFVKSLEKRDLSSGALAVLQKAEFEPIGNGLEWRIEASGKDADGTLLCMKIDFSKVNEKLAASGKSFLLASTAGNKPVAGTGILCGLNCFRPFDKQLVISALSVTDASNIEPGTKRVLPSGATVHYDDKNEIVSVKVNIESLKLNSSEETGEGESIGESAAKSSHIFRCGEIQVQVHIKPVNTKGKKRKVEGDSLSVEGFSSNEKVKNIKCHYAAETAELELSFDPSKSFGVSASGKSITVASSSGFQTVHSSDGKELCSVNFNAFKSAGASLSVSVDDAKKAVENVLSKLPSDSLKEVSFKSVLQDVAASLNLSEESAKRYKDLIKQHVKEFMLKSSN